MSTLAYRILLTIEKMAFLRDKSVFHLGDKNDRLVFIEANQQVQSKPCAPGT